MGGGGTGKGTHDGRHVVALVGGGHQRPQVGLTVHAHCRGTLVLHVLGHSGWRQQPGGGAVVGEAAVSWWQAEVELLVGGCHEH